MAKIFIIDHYLDEDGDEELEMEEYGGGDTTQIFEISRHKIPHFTANDEILTAQWIENDLYDEDTEIWNRFKELEKAI